MNDTNIYTRENYIYISELITENMFPMISIITIIVLCIIYFDGYYIYFMYGYGCGKYRYKLAKTPNDQWCIIKLELFHISRTNEKRKNVINDKFAKYRTDLAKVISITDIHTDVKYKKAESAFRDSYTSYVSGSYVSSNFNENIK